MIDFDFEKRCYGCSACSNICPQNAICMKKNQEGFLIPIINKEKCINCGLCDKVCPHKNEKEVNEVTKSDKFMCAYRKDNNKYKSYTSSGIFSALALIFLNDGGYVCGCVWNDNMEAKHIVSNKLDDIKRMSYSKYVQSNITEIYKEIETLMKKKIKILFCGTPCQVFSIKKYFEKYDDYLYTLAIVCHGAPSPKVWEKYKEKLEKVNDSKMIDANFRYKGKYGWITPFTKYDFENGKSIKKLSFTDDPYVIAFGEDILHRNSCYNCKFKGSNSNADIVAGDYWGCSNKLLAKSKNKGISSLIIHSCKGEKILEEIKECFIYENITIEMMTKENSPVLNPVEFNSKRIGFYEKFKKNGNIEDLYIVMKSKKHKIKKIFYKFYVFEILKRILYFIKHK